MDCFADEDQRRWHGDPFPLNVTSVEDMASAADLFEPRRARWLGESLNRLALHEPNSPSFPVLSSDRPLNAVQTLVGQRIAESLRLHGMPEEDMSPESALRELQAAECSYDGVPSNLANYDAAKLKVLHSTHKPKKISQFLPPEPAKLIEHYDSQILLPEHNCHEPFSPYWDLKLRFDKKARTSFILKLYHAGLIGMRKSPKSFIGAFFVKKKDPGAIRMVLDCRGTNRLHQPPPVTRLGSARCYADLQIEPTSSDEREGPWGMEADVCDADAFYNFSIPELTHYFAFNHPLLAAEWSQLGIECGSVFCPEVRGWVPVDADEFIYPCVEAVPMGWSWALFLCNEAIMSIARSCSPWAEGCFRERKPTPQFADHRTLLGVYVDNMTILGNSREDVVVRAEALTEAFESG